MCGRFFISLAGEDQLLSAAVEEASRRLRLLTGESAVAQGEVVPSAVAAALARGKNGQTGAFPMRWGYHRPQGKGLIINTRSETAAASPLFGPSMAQRRCLIPASWYFEWETAPQDAPALQIRAASAPRRKAGTAEKIKYAIRPQAPGLMYLAAIYRYEEGQKLPVFSILTKAPAPEIAFIHNRMPVIFTAETRDAWLDPAADPREVLEQCEQAMVYRSV